MNVKHLTVAYTAALGTSKPLVHKTGSPAQTDTKSIQVALSAGSQALSETNKDVDMERVKAIREALANGTLTVNPERIAQGLIDNAKSLL